MYRCSPLLGLLALALFASPTLAQDVWESEIVFGDADGRLVYVTDDEGNRIPDFSYAGYARGEVDLPDVPTVETVTPIEGDDTAQIQAALDAVGAREPNANGFRGAVELAAGTFEVLGTLVLREHGVVLRGAGDGDDPATSSILVRRGANQDPVVFLGRREAAVGDAIILRDDSRGEAAILDDIVAIGARSFAVDHPERFAVGDDVVVHHPATAEWLAAVDGGGTATDDPWAVDAMPIVFVRTIEAIDGSTITVDAPMMTRLDKSLSPSTLYHRDRLQVVEEVGMESLRIDIETDGPMAEAQARNAVVFGLVENAWAQGVTALHFWHAGFSVQNSRYVTIRNCQALEPHSVVDATKRYNFEAFKSQLVLFEGNRATEARHSYVNNGETLDSGIVYLENTSEDASAASEGHRRWGMGLLFDGHVEVGSPLSLRIHLGNRGDFGTSHGWACAHCVAWNVTMNGSAVGVEKPPTAQNYAIGTQGVAADQGPFLRDTGAYIEGTNRSGLSPRSLYRAQLQARTNPVAAEPESPARGIDLSPPFPNPVDGAGFVDVELARPGAVELTVVDVLGRTVAVLADMQVAAGRSRFALDADPLAPGTYVVRLAATVGGEPFHTTRQLVVSR
ncbi:MAG: T9SS type A sorting domain-containing protein [Bacteroidota bacterium]